MCLIISIFYSNIYILKIKILNKFIINFLNTNRIINQNNTNIYIYILIFR
jgi:hypothetical protein